MKRAMLLVLALSLAGLSGCARSYVITTANGRQVMTASKPKLKEGNYVYKDAQGQPAYVPAGRVRAIAPASMVKEQKPRFNPSTGK